MTEHRYSFGIGRCARPLSVHNREKPGGQYFRSAVYPPFCSFGVAAVSPRDMADSTPNTLSFLNTR